MAQKSEPRQVDVAQELDMSFVIWVYEIAVEAIFPLAATIVQIGEEIQHFYAKFCFPRLQRRMCFFQQLVLLRSILLIWVNASDDDMGTDRTTETHELKQTRQEQKHGFTASLIDSLIPKPKTDNDERRRLWSDVLEEAFDRQTCIRA